MYTGANDCPRPQAPSAGEANFNCSPISAGPYLYCSVLAILHAGSSGACLLCGQTLFRVTAVAQQPVKYHRDWVPLEDYCFAQIAAQNRQSGVYAAHTAEYTARTIIQYHQKPNGEEMGPALIKLQLRTG